MSDWGLYTALQGRRDWSQVRQDRQNEIAYAKAMSEDLDKRMAEEAKAREGVQTYLNQIKQAKALDFDIEKIKGVEQESRKKVIQGIQDAGGSYQKFLLGGGTSILNTYYSSIMDSDAMKNAQNNKLAFAQHSLDQYLGRVERPVMDEQGNPLPRMEEQLNMAQSGNLDKLTYNGSVKPLDNEQIRKAIENAYTANRYKKTAATANDIHNVALEFGAEDWYAKQLAQGYEQGLKGGGQPIYFKSDAYPSSSGGGSGDKIPPELYAKRDELIRGIQGSGKEYLSGMIGGKVGDDNVVSAQYKDNDKGEKNLVLILDRTSEQPVLSDNGEPVYSWLKEGKDVDANNLANWKQATEKNAPKGYTRGDVVNKERPKEVWINLTDPAAYINLNNILNSSTGYKIPIEQLDIENKKAGRVGDVVPQTGNTQKATELTGKIDPASLQNGASYIVNGKEYTWNGSNLIAK